jgi:hypothetical protein
MPASFAIGHSINHHKFNNGPADVVSTADKPRDEWVHLCAAARALNRRESLPAHSAPPHMRAL